MSLNSSVEMSKTFKLPLLPGNTCGEELLRKSYRKTQLLSGTGEKHLKSHPIPVDFGNSLNVARVSMTQTAGSTMGSTGGGGTASLDRMVLRFYGYYRESVPESNMERERIRKVVICYHLEDDTVAVTEPRQDNSGIAFQGTMVKRHQIPNTDGSGPVTFDKLAVGETISFYGRSFMVVDCDSFTRDFMGSMGVQMSDPIPYPADNYTEVRGKPLKQAGVESISASSINASGRKVKLSQPEIRAAKQFFENDRKVLRFDVVWDDTKALYGEKHFFTLYYFLADDSIEVVEKSGVNTGRDPFPSFVRRQKMMKPRDPSRFEGLKSATIATAARDVSTYYTEADLRIGNTVILFGRPMLICDCDKFTRQFMQEKYGISDYQPIDCTVKPKPLPVREPPPHNGFGDEEDSLASCKKLDIKPPRKDGTKFAKYGNNVVKFALKLENGVPTDEIRRFVLSCFLADDTITIFEPVQRNSGIVGGKFLQRQKSKSPETGKPYIAQDFFVGRHVTINGFPFVVQATDERSLSYMETNSSSFPKSNINTIIHKIQAMLQSSKSGLAETFHRADVDGSGTLDYKEMVTLFQNLELPICEQEVLTVLRFFDRNGDAFISYEEFISRIAPEGSVVGRDDRTWEEIHSTMVNDEYENLSVADSVAKQHQQVTATTAAYAARSFIEQYQNRRTLFHQEFKFICDYAQDEKIGEKEFRACVMDKLKLNMTQTQLEALCDKFFPPGARRVGYNEFLRLINGTSNLSHNMTQIRERRM